MRLPGFDHCKQGRFRTHCVGVHEAPPFTLAKFREAFELDNVFALPAANDATHTRRQLLDRIPEGKRNNTLFSLACGLVKKGLDAGAVNQRLQRINAERCEPQLCATDVDAIVAQACSYGSDGFAMLPHKLLDSPEWKALTPAAHDIIVTAFRRYDSTNNGNIALTWEGDFEALPSFGAKRRFYRHRTAAVRSGILLRVKQGANTQGGRKPDLFAIAQKWLKAVSPGSKRKPCASVQKVHPYIDKQRGDAVVSAARPRASPEREGAA
jgi:hypothetical protein